MRIAGALAAGVALCGGAAADVVAAEPDGFVVRVEVEVAADPDAVWARLIRPSDYWSDNHTWSGSAANMSLTPEIGGCWCERWIDADGRAQAVRHAEVAAMQPPRQLVLDAGLGPLLGYGATTHLTWTLTPTGETTRLTGLYRVSGSSTSKLDALAGPVNGVLAEMATRLADSFEPTP